MKYLKISCLETNETPPTWFLNQFLKVEKITVLSSVFYHLENKVEYLIA